MVALDLETYDYNKGSQTLIRATEGTILDRLPPRMQVRRGAPLELPHILVLYDDPEFRVLKDVLEAKARLPLCYEFELMLGSGHLQGRLVAETALIDSVLSGLHALIESEAFASKYELPGGAPPLLFAMGDGNHSLATAKAIWEELKPTVGMIIPRATRWLKSSISMIPRLTLKLSIASFLMFRLISRSSSNKTLVQTLSSTKG